MGAVGNVTRLSKRGLERGRDILNQHRCAEQGYLGREMSVDTCIASSISESGGRIRIIDTQFQLFQGFLVPVRHNQVKSQFLENLLTLGE